MKCRIIEQSGTVSSNESLHFINQITMNRGI